MIQINLLPDIERQSTFRTGLLYGTLLGIILFVFAFIYAYQAIRIVTMEQEIQSFNQQEIRARPLQEKMVVAKQKQHIIEVKDDILKKLVNERVAWAPMLSHLATVALPEVWFTEVNGEKGTLKIKGNTIDYIFAATFLQRFEEDPFFMEPVLVNASKDEKQSVTKFEIMIKLKGL